ncbi:sperm acrosome membrane-associated protein 1 [Chroicocephalus ridibundus]|uniref:sperm acrosome membrane-associated protein 1 n=1 Tax=Chroicocephalus ridibundus TaxID=1192867 RepID=UPI002FDDE478
MAGGLRLLLPLLLASLAAGAAIGGSAEAPSGRAEPGPSASVSPQIEFGECTVTCGIGIREVLLTSGCPGTETKCIVGVEECRTSVDCGWGIPISDGLACVKIACIFMPPEYRFKYVWKMLIPNKTAHILPSDSSIMKVCRDTHSGTFQCETQEKGTTVASIKYTVYAKTEEASFLRPELAEHIICFRLKHANGPIDLSSRIETEQSRRTTTKPEQSRTTTKLEQSMRTTTNAILVFSLVTGIIVTVGVIIPMIFMICYWGAVKSFWKSKFVQDNQKKELDDKRSLE